MRRLASWALFLATSSVLVVAGCSSSTDSTPAANDDDSTSTPPGSDASTPPAPPELQRCLTPPCADGEKCVENGDCSSDKCTDRICRALSSTDGIRNGNETDIDCGGAPPESTPRCATGKACLQTGDCDAVLCTGNVCAAPAANDGIKNGTETGVDCGGAAPTNAPRCVVGGTCAATTDCDAVLCTGGVCQPPSHGDGIKNGNETGPDCGGPDAINRCGEGVGCAATTDCDARKCSAGTCQPQSGNDGIKNGSETDIDCGGGAPTNAARCAVDKTCTTHDDCGSSACAKSGPKAGKCVAYKSCVENNGFSGNVRGWVQNPATKPAGWNSSWDMLVPATVNDAEVMLGDYWLNAPNDNPNLGDEKEISKRSCGNDNYNGHTYWVSRESASAQVFTQAQLDPKLLNCVGWHLVKAFCAWDGGHLATRSELYNAFTNGNTTYWPWEYTNGPYRLPALDPAVLAEGNSAQDDRLNHHYIYGFPGNQPANSRITWWISPPGRFYKGWNANKIEIVGNALEWTGDSEYRFVWNESFENHNGRIDDGGDWRTPGDPNDRGDVPNGYYALGARCAYP